MGLIKNEMMEFYEYDLRRYNELKEMDLENIINEIDKEVEEAKDEIISFIDDDDIDKLDDIDSFILEIKDLKLRKTEYEDLIAERNELKNQLKR
ncbi:hypothetical protein [Clostridium perfringens]|uniref:hypothetical protein n=1 Tax=Clostridium perfringens TaxID=1502 RepID=UPI003A1B2F1A